MTIRPFTPDDDLAPGMSDAEVENEARALWLEEKEQEIDDKLDLPVTRYDWS